MTRPDVRFDVFYRAVQNRLMASGALTAILGGSRIYGPTDDIPATPADVADANKPWGRIILSSVRGFFGSDEDPREGIVVRLLVKVEFRDVRAKGYDVGVSIYAAHAEVWTLLDNWGPGDVGSAPAPIDRVYTRQPVTRSQRPDPAPLLDDRNGLWVATAEYKTTLVPTAVG